MMDGLQIRPTSDEKEPQLAGGGSDVFGGGGPGGFGAAFGASPAPGTAAKTMVLSSLITGSCSVELGSST